MNAKLELPIGVLASDLDAWIEESERVQRGQELLEKLEREREENERERQAPVFFI